MSKISAAIQFVDELYLYCLTLFTYWRLRPKLNKESLHLLLPASAFKLIDTL